MRQKPLVKLSKSEKEEMGFKRLMTMQDLEKILQQLGYLSISRYTIGKFASLNGYETFDKRFNGQQIKLYKIAGTPTPNLIRKTYVLE
ncbi:hypothetical protein [Parabacteroides sp.]